MAIDDPPVNRGGMGRSERVLVKSDVAAVVKGKKYQSTAKLERAEKIG